MDNGTFSLWVFGDAHVGTDLKRGGNHDRSGLDEPAGWWWQKWIDPMGEHTEFSNVDPRNRPYPVEGTWERYAFRVGNILFLMMSDINEPSQKVGRGDLGGNPGGVVSGETFHYLAGHPGAVDIWLGGHTHTHPGDTCGNKSHVEEKWGTHFINAACLSRYHGFTNVPKSRLLTFREGSQDLLVSCYMHSNEFLPQGWYDNATRWVKLDRAFHLVPGNQKSCTQEQGPF